LVFFSKIIWYISAVTVCQTRHAPLISRFWFR